MVDALESVRSALRSGGIVVDLQPEAIYAPALAVRDRGRHRPVGAIVRPDDEDVIAANAAREWAVETGRFRTLAHLRPTYRTSIASLEALDAEKRSHTPPWRLAPGTRGRLLAAWRSRGRGAAIEVTRRMTLTVLRKVD